MKSRFEENEAQFQKEIGRIALSDVGLLLKYARRLKSVQGQSSCKIAVLGSRSIQYFVQVLRVLLYRDGICAQIYEGEYDGIRPDVMDAGSGFYKFRPDITVMLTDYRDIREFPGLFDTQEQVLACIGRTVEACRAIWETLHVRLPDCQVIMSNYVVPVERVLGNLECNYIFSRQSFYRMVNEALVREHPQYVLLADMEYLASLYGKLDWFDNSAYMLSKIPFALKYTGYAADLFARLIGACTGVINKCIVLDLDNTLWGGVVSEEGPNEIKTDPNDAVGEAFCFFQSYLKLLEGRGIILAVCSKNDMQVAKEPFSKNSNMILKPDDFAAFYANWDDKAANIRRIAEEINIGLDSIVFFDDNPAERELVRTQLPGVTVVDVPAEPADYVWALELSGCFQWAALTAEDVGRAATYTADRKRDSLLTAATDYDTYLRQLNMRGCVRAVDSGMIRRFSQLVNKSNQFNLRTKRYTEAELSGMLGRDGYRLLAASLADKFSNYGVVSCVILRKDGQVCLIDTWVMSCRVLKRGLEYLMFCHILKTAREWGCTVLRGEFIPTEKNGMVGTLLPELGFERDLDYRERDAVRYRYDLRLEFRKECFIEEEEA